jgi:hypothetical protein
MNKVEFDRMGLIRIGKYKGWYIKIMPEEMGGHLILYTKDPSIPLHSLPPDGFDHWIEKTKLQQYIEELQLEINWL